MVIWLPVILTLAICGLELFNKYKRLLPTLETVKVVDCPTGKTVLVWFKVIAPPVEILLVADPQEVPVDG